MAYGEEEGPLGPVSAYGSVADQKSTVSENEWKDYEAERANVSAQPRRQTLADRLFWWSLKYVVLPLALVMWTAQTIVEDVSLSENDLALYVGGWVIYLALMARWFVRRRARSRRSEIQ
jgi:hypothetical protein